MSTASAAESLWKVLAVPSSKISIDANAFVLYILPPVVCNLVGALLVVIPQTRISRVALWPVTALLAFRAALSVDMSLGRVEQKFLNINLVLSMLSIATRSFDWALAKEPLVRNFRPGNGPPSTVVDALDLASNFRGLGWEWSRGLHIPREMRPANRTAFVFYTLISAIAHNLVCAAIHRTILTLAPLGIGPIPEGSTIFDETLPFLLRYLRSSIISILTAFSIYSVIQMNYDLSTIPAILLLGQDPAQWPPVFNAPWFSTSLSDFWGRRWHQLFRRMFLVLGGYPLSFVLGRPGIVIGSFLASVVVHQFAMLALDSRVEMRWMLLGFGMMIPGILAERAFYRLTGRRVGGVVGWVWTMTWLLLWGNAMVEGFARAGMFGCASFVDGALPVRISVEHLVADFDAWLHTL